MRYLWCFFVAIIAEGLGATQRRAHGDVVVSLGSSATKPGGSLGYQVPKRGVRGAALLLVSEPPQPEVGFVGTTPAAPSSAAGHFPSSSTARPPPYLHFEAKKTPRGEISRPFSLSIMREPRLQAL